MRQLRVVEPPQRGREPLVCLEDRAARRLGRVRGQHRAHLEARRCRAQLVVPDAGFPQARDCIGERLARHASLVLVLAPPSQPVVLLGDVRELEEERERAQDGGLLLEIELADRLLELGAAARLPRLAREPADPLLQREQLLALLLDEDLPEDVPEQADVGAELSLASDHHHGDSTFEAAVPSRDQRGRYGPCWDRTSDLGIKSPLLYQLS